MTAARYSQHSAVGDVGDIGKPDPIWGWGGEVARDQADALKWFKEEEHDPDEDRTSADLWGAVAWVPVAMRRVSVRSWSAASPADRVVFAGLIRSSHCAIWHGTRARGDEAACLNATARELAKPQACK
jgi:hypothetical protein